MLPVSATPPANPAKIADSAMAQAMSLSWQGPNQAKVGDKISIVLNTQSSHGVKSYALEVSFDPDVLKAVDVNEGDALKQNNAQARMNKNIDQTAGIITADLSGAGGSGSGNLVTLTFEVLAAAQGTSVSINSITATGSNGEGLPQNAPEPHVISLTQ
jgi:general secretion pathway protein D